MGAQVPGELLPWSPGFFSTGTGERPSTARALTYLGFVEVVVVVVEAERT